MKGLCPECETMHKAAETCPWFDRDLRQMENEIARELFSMADRNGEIAFTSNTRDILNQADTLGLAKAVSGKFREVEQGNLNSIYRIVAPVRRAS